MQITFYGLSLQEAMVSWRPLIIFVIGVAIYSIFVFKFYRFLARKKIMELKLSEYELHPGLKKFLHGLEVIFLFPFIVFFWFFVMSLLLTLISINQTIESILYISVAFVSVVRIAAYYNEDLSKEIAKLIPFALLATFIMDASFLSWGNSFALIGQLFPVWMTLEYYLVFVILLEIFLRIVTLRKHEPKPQKENPKNSEELETYEESSDELEKVSELASKGT